MYNTLMQPGSTISPGTSPEPQQNPGAPQPQPPIPPTPQPEAPEPTPVPTADPTPEQAQPVSAGADPQTPWSFSKADASDPPNDQYTPPHSAVNPVQWTASEYIKHDKSVGWYMLVVLVVGICAGVVYLLTKEVISAVVVGVVGVGFVAFGARTPQTLQYMVDDTGVHIGNKFYPYGLFKSFSILQEDAVRSILLMPMQRFNLPITIYYDPSDEGEITDVIGSALPHVDRDVAPIDRFMSKIRF